ncbi:hypothetical protein VKT23_015544 [Stygiomarasmius scandens]|uniref:Uncharacterized protein n=1 Tax=Marasmiellus scandens TaxID=2682957 RepID=A0ABR1IZK9_9AGAR
MTLQLMYEQNLLTYRPLKSSVSAVRNLKSQETDSWRRPPAQLRVDTEGCRQVQIRRST